MRKFQCILVSRISPLSAVEKPKWPYCREKCLECVGRVSIQIGILQNLVRRHCRSGQYEAQSVHWSSRPHPYRDAHRPRPHSVQQGSKVNNFELWQRSGLVCPRTRLLLCKKHIHQCMLGREHIRHNSINFIAQQQKYVSGTSLMLKHFSLHSEPV